MGTSKIGEMQRDKRMSIWPSCEWFISLDHTHGTLQPWPPTSKLVCNLCMTREKSYKNCIFFWACIQLTKMNSNRKISNYTWQFVGTARADRFLACITVISRCPVCMSYLKTNTTAGCTETIVLIHMLSYYVYLTETICFRHEYSNCTKIRYNITNKMSP